MADPKDTGLKNDPKYAATKTVNLSTEEDGNTPILDTKTTSVDGILRLVLQNTLKESVYDKQKTFVGQILKGSDTLDCVGSNDFIEMSLEKMTEQESVVQKCKVRVFGVMDAYPVPCTFGENEEDLSTINLYPDATYERKNGDITTLTVGDIVKVEFEDEQKTKPKIIYKYSAVNLGNATISPIGPKQERCKDRTSTIMAYSQPINAPIQEASLKLKESIEKTFNQLVAENKYTLYSNEISEGVKQFSSLTPELVLAVISVESKFDPKATSLRNGKPNARGLMQIILSQNPSIAKLYWDNDAKKKDKKNKLRALFNAKFKPTDTEGPAGIDIYNPAQNIWIGCAILDENIRTFPDNFDRAIASYNQGTRVVKKPNWLELIKQVNGGEGFRYILVVKEYMRLIKKQGTLVASK